MRKKIILAVVVVSILVGITLFGVSGRTLNAEGAGAVDTALAVKIDQVLSNQKLILDELAGLKEDIRIVTVRVTQSQ